MEKERKSPIGSLPNGDLIYPNEELNLDNIQEVDNFVLKMREKFLEMHEKCHHCGTWVSRCDMDVDSSINTYCPSCFDQHCHTCGNCGEIYHEDEMSRVGDKWFCNEHARFYRVCADCGAAHRRVDMYPYDHMHLSLDAHKNLAQYLANAIPDMI